MTGADTTKDQDAQAATEVAKLDLSKYRTRELAGRIKDVISIPGAVLKVAITAVLFSFLIQCTIVVMLYFSAASGLGWIVVCIYALATSAFLGPLLGLLRVIYEGLKNVEEILRIIINIAEQAADDSQHLQLGTKRMPTGAELITQVYDDVILPTLEEVVSGVFFIFGTPILWLYRRTIGSAVRYLIKLVALRRVSDEKQTEVSESVKTAITGTGEYSQQIKAYTTRAANVVEGIGGKLRAYLMRPLLFGYCLLLITAALPIVLYRWWVGAPLEEAPALINEIPNLVNEIAR